MNSDCRAISAGLFQTLRPGPASLSDLGSQCTGGQHKFPACGSLCQSEDKVSWLFWSPQCSEQSLGFFCISPCLAPQERLVIHSPSLLNTYYMPGTIPGPRDTVVNLTEALLTL